MSGPDRVGRYEIVDELAVGGMARLFRARTRGPHGFEKLVVIKTILPHLAASESFRQMFIDEARIAVRLEHPKIVQILELGTDGDELFIAMELVDGPDVLTMLRGCARAHRRMPMELAVHIAHEVLDALDFAHEATGDDGKPLGVVHRDISPGNILVSRRGHVKLTDFGIARAAERHQKTEAGTLKGKFSYMSPEQVLGREVDARSDLFAVGTVLSEMLTGRHLFNAQSDLDVLIMVRDVKLDRLDKHGADLPGDLREILLGALTRDPDDRYQSAGEMRDVLGDWLFARSARVGASELAELVASVAPRRGGGGVVAAEIPHVSTLSGPTTRRAQLDAEEAARVGRALFSRGESSSDAVPEAVAAVESDGIIIEEAPPEEAQADRVADFAALSPVRILFDIACTGRTGRLVAEGPHADAQVMKEAYFEGGHPVFVRSNVMAERLGQYLVRSGAISAQSLERALRVLPNFGGRLGDTLVGLQLMQPMRAVRFLSEQVREKLVELCSWTAGECRWYEGVANPWPAVALHLDTFDIIGRGVDAIDGARLEAWGLGASHQRIQAIEPRVNLDLFSLGHRPASVHRMLDGIHTIGELAQRYAPGSERLELVRMLYLLLQIGAARAGD